MSPNPPSSSRRRIFILGALAAALAAASQQSAATDITLTAPGGTLSLVSDTSTNWGYNVTVAGTGKVTITVGPSAASISTTQTCGTLTIGSQTLSGVQSKNVTGGTQTMVFGDTTLTGDPIFDIASNGSSGAMVGTLGSINDGGVARSITVQNAGTLILTAPAVSLISGSVLNIINTAIVQLNNSQALGNASINLRTALLRVGQFDISNPITVVSGGGFTVISTQSESAQVSGNIILNNNLNLGGNIEFSGVINDGTGSFSLISNASGTITLSNANTYDGGTNISGSTTWRATNSNAFGTGAITLASGNATLQFGGGSALTGGLNIPNNVVVSSGSGTATLSAGNTSGTNTLSGNITLNRALSIAGSGGILQINGSISGNFPVTFNNAGTFILNGANNSSAGTKISAGTVQVSSDAALGTAAATLTIDGGTLAIASPASLLSTGKSLGVSTFSSDRPLTVTASGGTINAADASVSFSGARNYNWNGTLQLTGNPGSSVTLNRDAASTGTVTINPAATLSVAASATLHIVGTSDPLSSGGTSAKIINAGILDFTGSKTVASLDGNPGTTSAQLASVGNTTLNTNTLLATSRIRQSSLTLHGDSLNTTAKLSIPDSSPTFAQNSLVPSGNDAFVSVLHSLTIDHTGNSYFATVDLANNDLIIDYSDTGTSPLTSVEAMLQSGYNNGTWTGKGLTSSTAAQNPGRFALTILDNFTSPTHFNSFDGIDVSSHQQVIVKFSWLADVDLDGIVTSNDAITFAAHYTEGAFANHQTGDLNYNGIFDSNDAILFAAAYNESLPHLPEPASLALLALAAPTLFPRRKRPS